MRRIMPSAISVLLVLSCAGAPTARTRLVGVDDFILQLQNIDLAAIGATGYDLAVIDYSADGSAAGSWPAEEIRTLGSSGGGKIVLA